MIDTEIVQQFARIFAAFEHTTRPSTLLGFDLGSAPKDCHPKQLNVLRCDSDDLNLSGMFCDWWVVTSSGIAHHPEWPLPIGEYEGYEFFLTSPYLKFATNEQLIRYSLRLGPWYCAMQSPLIGFGKSEKTVEVLYEHKG